jgi:hypothetical protein
MAADVERIDVSTARTETAQGARFIGVRLRGRCEVPQGSSRRVDPIRPIRIDGADPAEEQGDHLLLRLTGRGNRCRAGSQVHRSRIQQREGASRWRTGLDASRPANQGHLIVNQTRHSSRYGHDTYGGSRRPPSLWALPTAFFFPSAVGSCQPRHNAMSRIPKHTVAPASADAASGVFRTWPATTMIAPARAATA